MVSGVSGSLFRPNQAIHCIIKCSFVLPNAHLHPFVEAGTLMMIPLQGEPTAMARFFAEFTRAVRRPVLATIVAGALALPSISLPALARGPDGIADVAERVIDAVVNISTSQTVEAKGGPQATPQLPPGSPFEEFFEEFF